MTCVAAARAHGVEIIDGVYNDSAMRKASRRNARRRVTSASTARRSFIPTRFEPCNAAFSPDAAELAQAKKIIAAFDLPENQGKAWWRWTAAWWSACTPTWRAARSRSPRAIAARTA